MAFEFRPAETRDHACALDIWILQNPWTCGQLQVVSASTQTDIAPNHVRHASNRSPLYQGTRRRRAEEPRSTFGLVAAWAGIAASASRSRRSHHPRSLLASARMGNTSSGQQDPVRPRLEARLTNAALCKSNAPATGRSTCVHDYDGWGCLRTFDALRQALASPPIGQRAPRSTSDIDWSGCCYVWGGIRCA